MSKIFKQGDVLKTSLTVLGSLILTTGVVVAATTISTNIVTGGNLTVTGNSALTGTLGVTGQSTFGQASSTMSSVVGGWWAGGTATTSVSIAGVLTTPQLSVTGTSAFTGLTTLTNSSTTGNTSLAGALWVGGNATTTAAGALSLVSNLSVGGTVTATGAASLSSTLGVTGLATLVQASTTRLSVIDTFYVGTTATTTISGAGNVLVGGTLTSTAGLNTFGNVIMTGSSTLPTATSTGLITAQSMKVSSDGADSVISGLVFGTCGLPNGTSVAASSTAYMVCTIATGAIPTSGYAILIQKPGQANGGMPPDVFVTEASSTAASTIRIALYNAGTTGVGKQANGSYTTSQTALLGFIGIK